MCGIVGFAGFEDPSLLRAMNERILHRGPDGEGSFHSEFASIAMRRLAIIDIEHGSQPQFSGDSRVAIVFNGEIYNFKELRLELEGAGFRFRTQSDTEVILNGYLCWGSGVFSRLEGMFAIAIVDHRISGEPRLHLIRDRFGVKPLYFRREQSRLIFASELKCILCAMPRAPTLHIPSLLNYLQLRYVPGPDCLIAGVNKLPPGSIGTFDGKSFSVTRYWKPVLPKEKRATDEAEALDELDRRIEFAVRGRMVADVPVGAYLSGGLDSSLIVAKMVAMSEKKISTFSIGFGHPTDELSLARQTAELLGTDHHEIVFSAESFKYLDEIVWSLDEPLGDAIILPMYLLAKEARKSVKVVLAGEGADEIFGGYLFHKVIYALMRIQRHIPASAWNFLIHLVGLVPHWILDRVFPYPGKLGESGKRRLLALLSLAKSGSAGSLYRFFISLFSPVELRDALSPSMERHLRSWSPGVGCSGSEMTGGLDDVLCQQYADWLPDDILNNLDKMTMANSLEAREPYLDTNLFAYVASLPDSAKISGWNDKVLLRRLAKRMGLSRVAARSKKPFYMPIDFFFASEAFEAIRAKGLGQPAMRKLFKPEFLATQFGNPRNALEAKKVFSLVMLGLWLEKFNVEVQL